jgi:hypothetical protein
MLTIRQNQMTTLEEAARDNFKQHLADQLQQITDQPPDLDPLIQEAAAFYLRGQADVTRFATVLVSQGLRSAADLPKLAQNALLAHGVPGHERLDQLETALGLDPAPLSGISASEIGAICQPCTPPPPPLKTDHWLEIELIGEDNGPIGWEEYQVTLPDGANVRGYVDGHGLARVENIAQPGDCSITFPRLDRRAWDWATASHSLSEDQLQ